MRLEDIVRISRFMPLISITLLVATILVSGPSAVCQEQNWFPYLVAASSSNGVFLAVTQYEYTDPRGGTRQTLEKVTYHVFAKEIFPQDRFSRPGTHWSTTAASWGVTVEGNFGGPGGWLPLVSNNGDYLVLIAVTSPVDANLDVIRIYRKSTGQSGSLIGTHSLQDLWPQNQVAPLAAPHVIPDRPLWYEGGSFEFSPDNQQLIYKTRWGNTVRVNLPDGKVSKE